MRTSALRILAVAALASAGVTCADNPISGVRQVSSASFALAPSFAVAPQGGPTIPVRRVRGVLRGSTDSSVTEANVVGDSAILVFDRVQVRGDSTLFTLGVLAFDSSNVLVFESEGPISVKPGDNPPAAPELSYTAPDATVDSIDVAGTGVSLDWAGSQANDCRNRLAVADPTATTQAQLAVNGFAAGAAVAGVRVGWTSRDTSVVTVDQRGIVRARCSNRSTYVVARTFLDEADSIQVSVTAPPFSLLMEPDSVDVARGDSVQLTAVVVDENGNAIPAAGVTWHSSDPARATVSASGFVKGVNNGRVQITAGSEGRITVGIVRVVRPPPARLVVAPGLDTLGVGQRRTFVARAVDATGRMIPDFEGPVSWTTSNTTVATIDQGGSVTATAAGAATILAQFGAVKDSARLVVETTRPPGSISARVVHAQTEAPLAGATITGPNGGTTSAGDGRFTLDGLQPGDSVKVSLDGYQTITLFDAPVHPNTVLQLPDAPMVPFSTALGSMSGTVKHAVAQQGVSGITVKVYKGVNGGPSVSRPSVAPVAQTTTGTGGSYSLPGLSAGLYTLIFSADGYSAVISIGVVIGGQNTPQDAVLIPPTTASGALVVILTWGDTSETNVPDDLDLHLTGPTVSDTANRFHVYHANRRYTFSSDTVAALDLDDLTGPGPEVIGLRSSAIPGTYRLYVHDFSNRATSTSRALADSSDARVDVFLDNKLIGTFFPPFGVQGTLWKVFEYDGARIRPINTIEHPAGGDATALPMIVGPVDPWLLDVSRIAATLTAPKQ